MINTDFLHSVQNGDEDAIQALIRSHQRQVFQLALSILDTAKSDPGEAAQQAEIATRETFITAVDRIGRYHEDTNFNTWLYGIAIQVARRRAKRWQMARGLGHLWLQVTRSPAAGRLPAAEKISVDERLLAAEKQPAEDRLPLTSRPHAAESPAGGAGAAPDMVTPMRSGVTDSSGNPAGTPGAGGDAALWDAVRGLDERLRLPVVLRYYHDFSIADIAALLKTSEGSVHARLDQARDKLAGK